MKDTAWVQALQPFRSGCMTEENGSALIETSITLLALLTLFFTIISLSRVVYVNHYVSYAAQQAARYAMVRGSTFASTTCSTASSYACQATATSVQNYVLSHVPMGVKANQVTVATYWPGAAATPLTCMAFGSTNSPGCEVQVHVSCSLPLHIAFLPLSVLTFSSTTAMTITQ